MFRRAMPTRLSARNNTENNAIYFRTLSVWFYTFGGASRTVVSSQPLRTLHLRVSLHSKYSQFGTTYRPIIRCTEIILSFWTFLISKFLNKARCFGSRLCFRLQTRRAPIIRGLICRVLRSLIHFKGCFSYGSTSYRIMRHFSYLKVFLWTSI
jgi:hypothetical protein